MHFPLPGYENARAPAAERRQDDVKRLLLVAAVTVGLLGLLAGPAFATHCGVVHKKPGAGAAATATVNADTGEFTITSADLNPAGNLKGNFITVTVVAGGRVVATVDVFKRDLPDGAHNAGPGDSECDGIGVDDFAECGG
jgi:hypothetical protein